MIINLRIKNFKAFADEVELDLTADMRIKKLACNVTKISNFNILKSLGIYGANNVGKTCVIDAIRCIKKVLSNDYPFRIIRNLFGSEMQTDLGITFEYLGHILSYDFSYNSEKKELVYEKISRLVRDKHGNLNSTLILLKDTVKKEYESYDPNFKEFLRMASGTGSVLYLLNLENFPRMEEIRNEMFDFAESIQILQASNIPVNKTISALKSDEGYRKKIASFIKHADVELDDIDFVPDRTDEKKLEDESDENSLNAIRSTRDELLRVRTYHKGNPVSSFLFDSRGTKKLIALASYIIDALENNKILVVDELESSFHFKLTRAIVSMFNNEVNTNAQLIFNTHDIALLDCKRLFRKEQIWFAEKTDEAIFLFSLADYTAENGVRGDSSDIAGKYLKGCLTALPAPDFIRSMLEEDYE